MKKNPVVSIITPVYNTEPAYLEEAILSVQNQSHDRIEHILIDDGSTKYETLNLLNKYKAHPKIRLLSFSKNKGRSMARNAAITLSKGEYISFLDSDDLLPQSAIKGLVDAAYKHSCLSAFGKNIVVPEIIDTHIIQNHLNTSASQSTHIIRNSNEILRECKGFTHIIYYKNLINSLDLKFKSYLVAGEDTLFLKSYLQGLDKLAFYDGEIYIQRKRLGSTFASNWSWEDQISFLKYFLLLKKRFYTYGVSYGLWENHIFSHLSFVLGRIAALDSEQKQEKALIIFLKIIDIDNMDMSQYKNILYRPGQIKVFEILKTKNINHILSYAKSTFLTIS